MRRRALPVVLMLGAVVCLVGIAQAQEGRGKPANDPPAAVEAPAEAAAPAGAADANAQAEPEPITFQFQPNSVSMNTNINFDQDGNVNNVNSNLNVGMRVKYQADAQPVVVRNIRITKVLTDALEHLTSQSQTSEQNLFSWENANQNQQRKEFYLHLSFSTPAKQAKKILEVSGTMDVVTTAGELSEAVLKPFTDYEGKRITFKNLPGQYMKFSREERRGRGNNTERLRVEMSKELRPHVGRIVFADEAGREFSYSGWSGGSNNNSEYRILNVDLPEKGIIRIQLYPKVETREVPFNIRDIPLVKPGEQAQPDDVMVELKPIAPIEGELTLERLTPVVEQ